MMLWRSLGAVAAVGVAAIIQLKLQSFLGVVPDMVLIVAVALSSLVSFAELLVVVLVGAWLLSWTPGASVELALILIIPLVASQRDRIMPWQPWFGALATVALAPLVFYGIVQPSALVLENHRFIGIWFADLAIGLVVYQVFRSIFPKKRFELLRS